MTWHAIQAQKPVTGQLVVPGSKSLSNRALLLAALADGPSELTGLLLARDTKLMIAALQSLGAEIEVDRTVKVIPHKFIGGTSIDVGLAGTVMRFVPPLAGLAAGETLFFGDPQASLRPMQITIQSLRQLGIDVKDEGRNTLPFTVCGTGSVKGGEVKIDASASSQFLSALLLVGARFDSGVTVINTAASIPSQPHIDMTINMLAEHGVKVQSTNNSWQVTPGKIAAINRIIEPDLSNATVFLAGAMVTAGKVSIKNWPLQTTQAGDQIRSIFQQMGGVVELTSEALTISGPAELKPISVDLSAVGELTPTIAAVAAVAPGISTLTGIAHLRGHETDRLAALVTELAKVGIKAVELPDGIEIHGGSLTPASTIMSSYHDHRMATFAAILGLQVELELDDIEATSKTLPDFAEMWQQLIAGVL
jgi:3-phosphoshikimate 1-carboxyvinyltransferase